MKGAPHFSFTSRTSTLKWQATWISWSGQSSRPLEVGMIRVTIRRECSGPSLWIRPVSLVSAIVLMRQEKSFRGEGSNTEIMLVDQVVLRKDQLIIVFNIFLTVKKSLTFFLYCSWREGKATIEPNFRQLVYSYGMSKAGNSETWNWMLDLYKNETNAQEKTKLMKGLVSWTLFFFLISLYWKFHFSIIKLMIQILLVT